jgi:hypothetical protein
MTQGATPGPTLDDLRKQRARDMLAVLDAAPATEIRKFGPIALRAGSARELEWLAPEVALRYRAQITEPALLHATVGVETPFTPSILVLTYTARYYLAIGDQPPAGTTRDVYVVYGVLQTAVLPDTETRSREL